MRNDLGGNPAFRELLARVRQGAIDAYANQDVPFEQVVEELAPPRDLGRNPLHQASFNLWVARERPLPISGIDTSPLAPFDVSAKFDLTLSLRESSGSLEASWDYSTDLFDAATIERMAGHFVVLLESIVADPGQRIGQLALMSPRERHRLMVEWNATVADYPRGCGLAQLFEAQAALTPAAIAVQDDTTTMTYAELDAGAGRLAACLRQRGVKPHSRVGICLQRSAGLILGLLGIVKAGAAYVPLDPELPAERLAVMLADAEARLVVSTEALSGALPATFAGSLVCLDRDRAEIAACVAIDPRPRALPTDLAYVMYTSGSTGRPKGVEVRQESVIRLVKGSNYVTLSPRDTIAHVSNVAFDATTFEVWGALLNGARVLVIPRDVVLSPTAFASTLARHDVSCVFVTTALFNRLSLDVPDAFRTVRTVLFGGEACDPERVRAVLRAGAPARLLHVYGPTEATTFATFHVVESVAVGQTLPIGRPISATEVFVLDRHGEPVPIGVTGEIHVGGVGTANGYVGRPAETAERFVPHPLRPIEERVYRTGDLGRFRPDGQLEFIGRDDDQVKIRGFRVECAEIGQTLGEHPSVRVAQVIAHRPSTGDQVLVAYVVSDENGGSTPSPAADFKAFLASRLPGYMIPAYYLSVPALPLTPNGKVDRDALERLFVQTPRVPAGRVGPRNDIERRLCRMLRDLLQIEQVAIDDDFFDIGGHSLLAAQLFARIDTEFATRLPLSVLFEAPTVRRLAEHLATADPASGHPVLVALTPGRSLPTIFGVPGVYGNVVGYSDLARALGADQPFCGLQSIGLDGRAPPFDSIPAIAARFVAEVRAVQPSGPYVLIGACFGASVAFEMARQLLDAGEAIAYLGLLAPTSRGEVAIDAAPTPSARWGKSSTVLARRFGPAAGLRNLVESRLALYRRDLEVLDLADRVRYLGRKFRGYGRWLFTPAARNASRREIDQRNVYLANVYAVDRYRRRPLVGDIRVLDVFQCNRPPSPRRAVSVDWDALWGGETHVLRMPGKDSGDMLTGENALAVAAALSVRLRLAFAHCEATRADSPAAAR